MGFLAQKEETITTLISNRENHSVVEKDKLDKDFTSSLYTASKILTIARTQTMDLQTHLSLLEGPVDEEELQEIKKTRNVPDRIGKALSEKELADIKIYENLGENLLKGYSKAYKKKVAMTVQQVIDRARITEQEWTNSETIPPVNQHVIEITIRSVDSEIQQKLLKRRHLMKFTAAFHPETIEIVGVEMSFDEISLEEVGTKLASKINHHINSNHLNKATLDLMEKPWYCCTCKTQSEPPKTLHILYPSETFRSEKELYTTLHEVGNAHFDAEHNSKLNSNEIQYYLLPPEHFSGTSIAFAHKDEVYIPTKPRIGTRKRNTYVHEATHAILYQKYGQNLCSTMIEGPTTGAEIELGQNRGINELDSIPIQQLQIKNKLKTLPVEEITFDVYKMFDKNTNKDKFLEYKYSNYFRAAFIINYGEEKYYELYKHTSNGIENLENPRTGAKVIHAKAAVASEEEIMEAALLTIGIEPLEMKQKLKDLAYVEKRSQPKTLRKKF